MKCIDKHNFVEDKLTIRFVDDLAEKREDVPAIFLNCADCDISVNFSGHFDTSGFIAGVKNTSQINLPSGTKIFIQKK